MSLIPKPYDFEPISVGDHIRKKRLKLGLLQKEAAHQIGVNAWTILNWEKGHTEPPSASVPGILRFLGYDPFPKPKTVSEHLRAKRRSMGWSIQEAAKIAGVDSGTWGDWERGKSIRQHQHQLLIRKLLNLSFDITDK
jgi:transcriptional regulator with XRE-family HTH domain